VLGFVCAVFALEQSSNITHHRTKYATYFGSIPKVCANLYTDMVDEKGQLK